MMFLSVLVLSVVMVIGTMGSDQLSRMESVGEQLQLKLSSLVNSTLEIEALENIYEIKTRRVKQEYNPEEIIRNISSSISDRLGVVVDVLKFNRDFIQKNGSNISSYQSNGANTKCCNGDKQYFDSRFGLVNSYQTCYSGMQRNIGQNVEEIYRKNLADSSILLWQYFGDAEGNYHQFPTLPRFCLNRREPIDHRFQDWYVHTASPMKKNLVIVIDESGSMSVPSGGFQNPNTPLRVDIARDAAMTVLETLSPSDHVGIVAFSNDPRSPPGCLGSKLAKATLQNKKSLHKFLQEITPKQDTYYGKAFTSAFKLLTEAKGQYPYQFENSLDMVLFLTDGTPTEPNIDVILEEIAKGQQNMNHSVQIFVYGFGKEILNSKSKNKTDLLMKMADQNNQKMSSMFGIRGGKELQWPHLPSLLDTTTPLGPVGNLSILPNVDKDQLRHVMGSYYTKFPMSQNTDYSVSLPHIEPNLGLVITLGIPTIDDAGDFFGVAAVDISLEMTFYEVVHFRQGRHSYGFIVANDGRVLFHPYMVDPHQQWTQPRFYLIHQIEPILSNEAIYNITNGIPGLFHSDMVSFWRKAETFSTGTKPATFYYDPILDFHGNYTAVLVIFDEDVEGLKADEDVENGDFPDFVYHRIDMYDNDTLSSSDICSQGDSLILQNNATVKFAPNVYLSPIEILKQNNNKSSPLYHHSKNAKLFSQTADIHQEASNDVVLTNITDSLWKRDDIKWRYLGTENGFFKIFPGTMLSDIHYDPREDLWYKKAYDNPEKYIFIDDGENSTFVTFAKVFHQSSNGSVSGVAAADISKHQFSVIIKNLLASCINCYILDDSGYVLENWKSNPNFVKKHVTEIAGHVSSLLMNQGFLKPEICMDATSGKKTLTYTLDLGQQQSVMRSEGCHDFILTTVNGTNLFLLMYQPDNCVSKVGTCICKETCILCDLKMDSICQCPCTCINKTIDDCSRNFTVTQGYVPCKDNQRHWKPVKNLSLKESNVSTCQPHCPSMLNRHSCRSVPGCEWCTTGIYTHIPMCTQNCVIDREEIHLHSPCTNLSAYNQSTVVRALKTVVQTSIKDTNLYVGAIHISQQNASFSISTKDSTPLPHRWTEILSKPIYILNDIVLIKESPSDDYHIIQVILTFNNVNFTDELEHELTLRDYLVTQVEALVHLLLNDTTSVSDIWPEQDEISFFVSSSSNTSDLLPEIRMWNTSSFPDIDVFGRKLNLINISVDNSYNSLCDVPCDKMLDKTKCNRVPECHWDIYSHGVCTNSSMLPERLEETVYFPCLGLYENLTVTDSEVIDSFKDFLSQVPVLNQTLSHIKLIKDDTLVGRQIKFTIQQRVTSASVTDIWWDVQQLIELKPLSYVNISSEEYHVTLHSTSYLQFTNMHVTLLLEGFNSDSVLNDHPLDGREEIKRALTSVISLYLRPQVISSLNSVKTDMNEVTFSVDNHNDKTSDLRTEYDILYTAVIGGNVSMEIFGQNYHVKDIVFIGSFHQLCPRQCHEGTQSTCGSIPGCDWSDLNNCSSEIIFPERVNVTVIFPCDDFENITDIERHQIILETETKLLDHFNNMTKSNIIGNTSFDQITNNVLTVTLQATSKSPSLRTLYNSAVQWLKDNKLSIITNNSTYTGYSDSDHNRMSLALEFDNITFTTESIQMREYVIQELTNRIKLVLSNGVNIENIWFTMNYSVFDIKRNNNSNLKADLSYEVEKIQKFIKLGGLSFNLDRRSFMPVDIHVHGETYCDNCLINQTCGYKKCFWCGKWDKHFCKRKNPDKMKYNVFLPCNQTIDLTSVERKESIISLKSEIFRLLYPAGQEIINDLIMNESGITIEIQTTPLHPYLESYFQSLRQNLDYKAGFSFGPQSQPERLIPRHRDDFTNVEIVLHFKSIDFDAIVNSGLSSYSEISALLQKQINTFILGDVAKSYHNRKIERDFIEFDLVKDTHSHIDMAKEIAKLKDLLDAGLVRIDVNYIRPVIATAMSVSGSFDKVCQSLAGHNIVPTYSTLPTFATNITKTPIFMIPIPTITVVYNRSTASKQNLLSVIDTGYVDVCFVDVNQCPKCLPSYSSHTCSFTETGVNEKTPKDNPYHIGPVQWTIITVSGIFILALALWAIQGIHEMTKKKKPPSQNTACSIEDRE